MERNIQGLSNASQFGGTAAPSDELTTEAPSPLASTAFQRGAHTLVALIESERRKLREAADQKRAKLEKELSEMSDKLSAAEQKVQELEAHCSTVEKELDTARNAQLTEQSEAQIWKERYVALDAQLAAAVSAKDAEIHGLKSRITIVEAENKRLQSVAVAAEDKDGDIQMDMIDTGDFINDFALGLIVNPMDEFLRDPTPVPSSTIGADFSMHNGAISPSRVMLDTNATPGPSRSLTIRIPRLSANERKLVIPPPPPVYMQGTFKRAPLSPPNEEEREVSFYDQSK